MALLKRVIRYLICNGAAYTLHRAGQMLSERVLHSYEKRARCQDLRIAEAAQQRSSQPAAGRISIVVPVYHPAPAALTALLDSVLAQTYQDWECILYDAGSTAQGVRETLDAVTDPRMRVIHASENEGISGNTNAAARCASGGYLAFCDHDDVLAPQAMWAAAQEIVRNAPDMIYSDEDRLSENGRFRSDPHCKPDFCPDNLRSGNYICHLMIVRRELFESLGGFRSAFDGSQDHDLALRITEVTDRIRHIPQMLYHWRNVASSMSHLHREKCLNAAARAVTEHMERMGLPGICKAENDVLRLRYDVPESLTVRVIRIPEGGGYAAMNREAAAATEDVLLFLHESVSGMSEGFVQELLMYAQRDDVAAVSPMLTDRKGRVTHAGYQVSARGIQCRNEGMSGNSPGRDGLGRVSRNVTAVSAACLMVRRDHFIPFDERWQDSLSAVDWCLRQRQIGRVCVLTPHARAVCTHALLRCDDDMADFRRKWPALQDGCVGVGRK